MLQGIASREEWQLEYITCAWQECLDALQAGKIDLMPDVAYSAQRDQIFDFHKTPSLYSWSQIYSRAETAIGSTFDLNGKRVAVLRGSIQEEFFSGMMMGFGLKVQMIPATNLTEVFDLVASGKADAATGPGVRNRAMPPSMVLSAGWNGSVEWGKVNGMLVKQESLLERRENGLGILDYTEKTMASSSNLKFIGRMKVRDQEAFIVEHRPESGVVAKMYFDVESYELLSADSSGPGRAAQMEFFDWKVVDGSYGPTRVTGKWNGKDLGMVITGIAYDPTIDAAIFSP